LIESKSMMNQPPTGASIVPRKPLKSGWLTKLGAIRKSWKSRYFELHPDSITYSEGSRGNGIKGKILTKDINAIVEPKDGLYRGKANVFGISTPNRVYYVSAQTRFQAMEWMDAIMKISPDIKIQSAHTTTRQSEQSKPRSASVNIPQTQPRQSKIVAENNNNNNTSSSLPKQNTGISSVPISAHTSVDLPEIDDNDALKETSFDLLPLDKYLGMLIKVNNQVGQQNPLIRMQKDQLLDTALKQANIEQGCWVESDQYWKSLFKSKSSDLVAHSNLIIDYARAYITYYEKQKEALSNMHRQLCGVASFLLDITEQPSFFTRDAPSNDNDIGSWKLIEVPQVDTFDKWIAVNTAFEYWSPRGNTSEDIFGKLNLTLNSVDWGVISFYWSLAMQSRFNPIKYLDFIQQYKALRPRYWNVYSSDENEDSVIADIAPLSKSL